MTTIKVDIGRDGSIAGVRTVGFHGEVVADYTPARCAPILVDDDQRLVRIVDVGSRFARIAKGVLLKDARGVGTFFEPPAAFSAIAGALVLVLGKTERRFADKILDVAKRTKSSAAEFLQMLSPALQFNHPRAFQQGDLIIFYVTPDEALELLDPVAIVALQEIASMDRSDLALLKSHGWWLSRAALTDDHLYLASAALHLAHVRHADSMLRAGLPEGRFEEARLADAVKRLDSLTEWPQSPTTRPVKRFLDAKYKPVHTIKVPA